MATGTAAAAMQTEDNLPYSLRAAVKPHMDSFVKYAKNGGVKITPAEFEQWDKDHNLGKVRALFPSDEELKEIGVKTMYNRVFYACVQTMLNATVGVATQLTDLLPKPEAKKPYAGSRFLKGIDRSNVGTLEGDSKNKLLEVALEAFKRAAKELSRYITPTKLHKLIDEVLAEA